MNGAVPRSEVCQQTPSQRIAFRTENDAEPAAVTRVKNRSDTDLETIVLGRLLDSVGQESATTGGRTWWAHVEFRRMNIAPSILQKRMEDDLDVRVFGTAQRSRVVGDRGPALY
jgi:hypothetical protein